MTLYRVKGDFTIECDACLDTLETGTGDFQSAQNILHRNRWHAYKEGEDWKHRCAACVRNRNQMVNFNYKH